MPPEIAPLRAVSRQFPDVSRLLFALCLLDQLADGRAERTGSLQASDSSMVAVPAGRLTGLSYTVTLHHSARLVKWHGAANSRRLDDKDMPTNT